MYESNDRVHVGFAYSLPKVYEVMGELGIKPLHIRNADPATASVLQ